MQFDGESGTVRELAERLVQASLYPSTLPEHLPLDVPVPSGGRLIGASDIRRSCRRAPPSRSAEAARS